MLGARNFFILCAAIVLAAMSVYFYIRRVYVYKEDREESTNQLEVVEKEK